jgi:hypothetical protein
MGNLFNKFAQKACSQIGNRLFVFWCLTLYLTNEHLRHVLCLPAVGIGRHGAMREVGSH